VGAWLVARGTRTSLRWDRHHLALLATALDPTPDAGAPDPGAPALGAARRDRGEPTGSPLDQVGHDLLAANAALVAERGHHGASIGAVAARAATSSGALYNRFSGKAGLLAETLAARADDVHDAVLVGAAPTDDQLFARRVAALLEARAEPELAATVDAVEGRALRALRRRATSAARRSTTRPAPPAAAAAALAALPLGQWVVGRVTGTPASVWEAANLRLAAQVAPGSG
jgi:AcrR family transcriptional regulator